ncbi:hypothetical protein LZ554_007305 [Drepanopeziza brunnea f. sp. 'monogermtubi']|nr:hypothetical protein LZ554_007305 [Drepanopeziza brunnea f. sp. 'monogermtubi']
MSSSSSTLKPGSSYEEKSIGDLRNVRTTSGVPRNPHYYELEGLRTEGDGQDHTAYNIGSSGFIMTLLGCSCGLAGAIIVPLLYLTLGTTIAYDLNATTSTLWMFTSMIIAEGALAPFVGPLADLFGRKPIFIAGVVVSVTGAILCAATPNAAGFIAGQVLLGIGAIIQELLAIAIAVEIVPTAKRSLYSALILCALIPWSPSTLYANWIATSSWRWIGLVIALWNLLTVGIIAFFYHPPPRVNSLGLTRREMIGRIDLVGGFLLTTGLLLFLVGLNWAGGQGYPWNSAHVLTLLVLGGSMILGFGAYEFFVAPYPLFPRRMVHAPRPFFCMLYVIFAGGINFIPLTAFWPIESITVFQTDRYQTGINTLPVGMGVTIGAIVSALLLSFVKGYIAYLMAFFCVMQTVGSACMVLINPDDVRTAFGPLMLALIGVGGVIVPNQVRIYISSSPILKPPLSQSTRRETSLSTSTTLLTHPITRKQVIITVITPDDLIASVTALTVGLRCQAQVIGLAIFFNRFTHAVTQRAATTLVPAALQIGVVDVAKIEAMVRGLTAMTVEEYAAVLPELAAGAGNVRLVVAAAQACFGGAFRLVYLITIAFGITACVASLGIGDLGRYLDDHVAVVL